MNANQLTTLSAAFDDYPQTRALKALDIRSDKVAFTFSPIKPANKFFKPCVRELRFDVSELAIGTFLMANSIADASRELDRVPEIRHKLDESSVWLEGFVTAPGPGPVERAEHEELLLRLVVALDGLPEDERAAVEMRYLQDPRCPLPEIARALGRPTAKAVAGLLARGLERLRGLLREAR